MHAGMLNSQQQPAAPTCRYLAWLQEGLAVEEAYLQRSAIYCRAKCYLQACADARAAVAALIRQQQAAAESDAGQQAAERRGRLATAYLRLGEACLAEPGHADRACREAAKAFMKGMDVDPESEELQEGLKEAGQELSKETLEQLAVEVYNEGSGVAGGLKNPAALGFADAPQPGQRVFRVELQLAFPQAKAGDFSSRGRELLRVGLAAAAGAEVRRVTIERVLPPGPKRQHLAVEAHVQVGTELLRGSDLLKAVQDEERLAEAIGGQQLVDLLGPPDLQLCSSELVDITPACAMLAADRAEQNVVDAEGVEVAAEDDRRLAVVSAWVGLMPWCWRCC